MYRRIIVMALAGLLFGTATARTLELVEGAYEAVLADVTMPGSTAGTLILKMCNTCDPVSLAVDSSTTYIGTSGVLTLADFRAQVAEIRQSSSANRTTAVGIYYSLATNRVTRVSLHASGN